MPVVYSENGHRHVVPKKVTTLDKTRKRVLESTAVPVGKSRVARSNVVVEAPKPKISEADFRSWIEEKIKNNSAKEDFKRVYGEKRLNDIYDRTLKGLKSLQNRHDNLSSDIVEQRAKKRLDSIVEIMQQRVLLQNRADNIKRQIQEIEEVSNEPYRMRVAPFLDQVHRNTPWSSQGRGWNVDRDGFGDHVGPNLDSWRGGNEEEYEKIANDQMPRYHTSQPSSSYQNNVLDSTTTAIEEILVNEATLEGAFEGRELTKQDRKKLNLRDRAKHVRNNIGETLAHSAYDTIGPAFRGLAYDTKAHKTNYFKKQMRKNYKTLSDLIYRVGPNYLDGAVYIKYLEGINEQLKNSKDPNDIALYNMVQQIISDRKNKLKEQVEKDVKAFEKQINDLSKSFYEKTKGFTKDEDDAFKWQVLCALTLIAPFAPAIAGIGSLNVVTPILDVVGKVFFGSQGFATSFANIANSLGPFSYLANMAKIPYATEWLLNNVPIVNAVLGNDGLMQLLTRNEISQELFGVLSPLRDSPLPLLVLGGFFATKLAGSSYQHYTKKWDTAKENQEQFQKTTDEFANLRRKNLEGIINGVKDEDGKEISSSIASDIIQAKKLAFRYGKTIDALCKISDKELEAFDNILLARTGSATPTETLSAMKKRCGEITPENLVQIFIGNGVVAGSQQYDQIEAIVAKVSGQTVQQYKGRCDAQLIASEAQKNGLLPNAKESDVVAAQKQKLSSLMYDNVPDGSIVPESVSSFMDRSRYQTAAPSA